MKDIEKLRRQKRESNKRCKERIKESQAKWKASAKGKARAKEAYHRKYANPKFRLRNMAYQCISRKGGDFDYLIELIEYYPNTCQCCQKTINYASKDLQRGFNADSPSFDRLDSKLAYVRDNVRIICMACNSAKNDSTIAQLELVLAYMKKYLS